MGVAKRYQIGQVLYALFVKEYKLLPFRIAEENVVRTLNGESTTYKVVYGPSASKMVDLGVLAEKSVIFEHLAEAHQTLLNQSKTMIDKVVSEASSQAKTWFPNAVSGYSSQVQSIDFSGLNESAGNQNENDESPMLELPDGTIARVKIGKPTAT